MTRRRALSPQYVPLYTTQAPKQFRDFCEKRNALSDVRFGGAFSVLIGWMAAGPGWLGNTSA
jgi:hypothetical protein